MFGVVNTGSLIETAHCRLDAVFQDDLDRAGRSLDRVFELGALAERRIGEDVAGDNLRVARRHALNRRAADANADAREILALNAGYDRAHAVLAAVAAAGADAQQAN